MLFFSRRVCLVFDTGVHLLNTDNLKLESMTEQKAFFVKEHFGDVRDTVCTILFELWGKLDERKLLVSDQLVLPLLRLTDSKHNKSREFGSSTYFDILRKGAKYSSHYIFHYIFHYILQPHLFFLFPPTPPFRY